MGVSELIEWVGDGPAVTSAGLIIGLAFGSLAQRSKFCLRAAIIEFAHGTLGERVAIWVLAFSTAVAMTQAEILTGVLDVSGARQLAARGSLSGAIIGGLMFGVGMILARGCASRLLVLSATGNLRALVSGLILTLVAQTSLRGVLAPARESLSALWTIEGGPARNILTLVKAGPLIGMLLGLVWLSVGIWLARRNRLAPTKALAAMGVGLVVAGGWAITYTLSQSTFAPIAVTSVSFTGPSADTLMALINSRSLPSGFDVGLVPGVFIGSLLAAVLFREFELQGFDGGSSMARYIAGACLMGFGGMLAGGCAVGAGVSGGAIFALTGWIALASMWVAAAATDYVVDRRDKPAAVLTSETNRTTAIAQPAIH
jgi:uncharacterized protein